MVSKTKTAKPTHSVQEHIQSREPRTEESINWSKTGELVSSFAYNSDFAAFREYHGATPEDQKSYEYAIALADYTTQFTEIHLQDGTLNDDEAARIRILGCFPAHSYNQKIVTDMAGAPLDKQGRQLYHKTKDQLVDYNQTVSSYIYNNNTVKLSDMLSAIITSTGMMNPDSQRELYMQITVTLRGARTEAINQRLVDRLMEMLPGHITGRRATQQEDRSGIDYVAEIDGDPIYMDFKSSIDALIRKGQAPTLEDLQNGFKIKTTGKGSSLRHIAVIIPTFDEDSLKDSCLLSEAEEGVAAVELANNFAKILAKTNPK